MDVKEIAHKQKLDEIITRETNVVTFKDGP